MFKSANYRFELKNAITSLVFHHSERHKGHAQTVDMTVPRTRNTPQLKRVHLVRHPGCGQDVCVMC